MDTYQKSFSDKIIPMNQKLKPGDLKSWPIFSGEFKSLIHADALAALNRSKPYTLAEVQRIAPYAYAPDMLMRLNSKMEIASEYLYRQLYGNTDFTVPSHGPSLMNMISRNFEASRDGIALFHHLAKSYDKRASEKGQEDLDKLVTPEAIRTRLAGALSPTLLETIIYSVHDDWARIEDNRDKPIWRILKLLLRQMKTLPHPEMSLLAFQHLTAMDDPGAKEKPQYASLTAFVDAIALHWPTVSAGSINVVHPPRPGGPTKPPPIIPTVNPVHIPSGKNGSDRGTYNSSTNDCRTCPLYTCFAKGDHEACQACGTRPSPFPADASNVQRQIGNATRLYAKQNGLKSVKDIKVGTFIPEMKALRDEVAKNFPPGLGKIVPQVKMTLSPHVSAAACAALEQQLVGNGDSPIMDFSALEKAMEDANLELAAEQGTDADLVVPLGELMPRLNVTAHPGDIDEALNALASMGETDVQETESPHVTVTVDAPPPPPPTDTPPVTVNITAPPPPPPSFTPPLPGPVAALAFNSGTDSGASASPRSPASADISLKHVE